MYGDYDLEELFDLREVYSLVLERLQKVPNRPSAELMNRHEVRLQLVNEEIARRRTDWKDGF